MTDLEGKKALVTGGSRGLGLGIVEALVARKADVTVVARDAARLAEVEKRLGVRVISGDIADESFAEHTLREVRPSVLVLNAGAQPALGLLHEQTWAGFSNTWNSDVKAGFHWLQAALRLPLPRGSRVLVGSSGAAVNGSPLSGGYAGAKRTLWFMTQYANVSAKELDLGITFQAIVPQRIIADTDLGRAAAEAYARRKGVSLEAFLAGFGAPMPPEKVGQYVVSILSDPKYESGVAFGLKGDGIVSLDG
ncbi:MAG TPA: SDR family oxidoreductase [Polyangiaceae bacterium]|nr:SDR family oxidoreductase [Polyangiaceae bacterium]